MISDDQHKSLLIVTFWVPGKYGYLSVVLLSPCSVEPKLRTLSEHMYWMPYYVYHDRETIKN